MRETTPPNPRKCASCLRSLALSCFGSSRHSVDGYNVWCKECISYDAHRKRKIRGFSNPENTKPHLVPMHVTQHNDKLVSLALLRGQLFLTALHIPTKEVLDVVAGQSSYGVFSIKVTNKKTGATYLDHINGMHDQKEFKRQILDALKAHQIRLEKDELDLHTALKLVYY